MAHFVEDDPKVKGPFIVWQNYEYNQWTPESYESLEEALKAEKHARYIITRPVKFKAVDINELG